MFSQIKEWWKKQWAYIPPVESDVISVKIVRKSSDGKVYEFSLDGDDANQWGWLQLNLKDFGRHCKAKRGYNQLNWKKQVIQ